MKHLAFAIFDTILIEEFLNYFEIRLSTEPCQKSSNSIKNS